MTTKYVSKYVTVSKKRGSGFSHTKLINKHTAANKQKPKQTIRNFQHKITYFNSVVKYETNAFVNVHWR